jgi:hypothetical protein
VTVAIKTTFLFIFLLFAFASCRISFGGFDSDGEDPVTGGIVVPGDGLAEKISWLRANARSGGDYSVELSKDDSVYQTFLYFLNRTNITITIKGGGANRIIDLLNWGNLFYVSRGVTLVLDSNITLAGYDENIYPLVYIAPGGVFIMNRGSAVTGNISSVTGAVYVDGGTFIMNGGAISGNSGGRICGSGVTMAGGIFIMNGGTISGNDAGSGGTVTMIGGNFTMNGCASSGNTARSGGAVMVNRGTFTMRGGTISDNTAGTYGGAVIIGVEGAFKMNGGTISGNAAGTYGGAVYVGLTGNFYMDGGTISNNTAAAYGWGVYVSGTFTKTGGTIGYDGGEGNVNTPGSNDLGLAVFAYSGSGVRKRRETAAGPGVDLFYSGRNGQYSGEWDF